MRFIKQPHYFQKLLMITFGSRKYSQKRLAETFAGHFFCVCDMANIQEVNINVDKLFRNVNQ